MSYPKSPPVQLPVLSPSRRCVFDEDRHYRIYALTGGGFELERKADRAFVVFDRDNATAFARMAYRAANIDAPIGSYAAYYFSATE